MHFLKFGFWILPKDKYVHLEISAYRATVLYGRLKSVVIVRENKKCLKYI